MECNWLISVVESEHLLLNSKKIKDKENYEIE